MLQEQPDLNPEVKKIHSEEPINLKRWSDAQDIALRTAVAAHGEKNWKNIAKFVPGRNHAQCLQVGWESISFRYSATFRYSSTFMYSDII